MLCILHPMSSVVTYCDVILPLALPRAFTYAVPVELAQLVRVGHRVIVPFKTNKFYTGIVATVHHNPPPVQAKLIETIADEEPIVTPGQLKLWQWMSEYYMSAIGEVMSAALPSGLKLSSETKFFFNEYYDGDFEALSEQEFLIVQALKNKRELSVPDVQQLLQRRNVYPSLRSLFNLGIAISKEEMAYKYKPRFETFVQLHAKFRNDEALEGLYEELQRAPKQVELLLAYTQLSKKAAYIKKQDLLEASGCDAGVLKRLTEKSVFVEVKSEVSRLGIFQTDAVEIAVLNEMQQQAVEAIKNAFAEKQTVLLKGVTGSGKTVVYTELIKETVEQGKQALFLLPEIALTAQLINRLRKFFGNQIGIYHSKFNLHERVEIWHKVLNGEYKIVLGARSALFLPFKQLGLIVVDEEHDASYKQQDPAPRYQARDAALMLAAHAGAKVVLGSATPSVESMFNAERGKFGLVEMKQRYGDGALPSIQVVNAKRSKNKKELHGNFTPQLIDEISKQLSEKRQIILFLNRRGYAEIQQCTTCDFVYRCSRCDVSLTFHKFQNKLVCHYCGFSMKPDVKCKSCGCPTLEIGGKGTEQIEEEIAALFPAASVARLDLDTMRTKHGYANVIASFENREIDILVGTQMVSKGLDFDNVGLVGILDADRLIYHPGYRSAERAYQMMTQVSGRAGRKHDTGKVIIQTSNVAHPVIHWVLQGNYRAMFETEIAQRMQFAYPPFTKLIQFTLRCKELKPLEQASLWLGNSFRKKVKADVLGPAIPFISKMNNYYLRELMVKPNKETASVQAMKTQLLETIHEMKQLKDFKQVDVSIDVDV